MSIILEHMLYTPDLVFGNQALLNNMQRFLVVCVSWSKQLMAEDARYLSYIAAGIEKQDDLRHSTSYARTGNARVDHISTRPYST